ncbi:MAG: Amylo-alpha,6-glucosidase [Micrococcaceae bacterium]|nr:Amylo-alpha,6-glucosidase [Micrococcaceae bacterium]
MAPQQPYLHHLTAVLAAPVQAWAAPDGQVTGNGAEGVYCGDDRVLDQVLLTVNGNEPEWISTRTQDAGTVEHLYFLRVDSPVADPLVQLLHTRRVTSDGVREVLRLESALDGATTVHLQMQLRRNHRTMADIKSGRNVAGEPPQRAAALHWRWRDDGTAARIEPGSATVTDDGDVVYLRWEVLLPPGEPVELFWRLHLTDAGAPLMGCRTAPLDVPPVNQPRVQRLLDRAIQDVNALRMAPVDAPGDGFLAAGAPWYFTLFGRDALISALMLLPIDLSLAGGTLRALAARQGTQADVSTAEQPGKILHELRREANSFGEGGTTITLPPVYYGTIDATLLWIVLLHEAWRAGLPDGEVAQQLEPLKRALGWLRDWADPDGDGFLEYLDASGSGLANQGWKDSADAIRRQNGSLAPGPIALAEVQGYAHRAALAGAALLDHFGQEGAGFWRDYARRLNERFRAQFWCADASGPYPALALDAGKNRVDGIASNMGHLLGTGLLNPKEETLVVRRLMDADLFSGYGIRTLSHSNGAYWPTRYHGGSVWTHDTALILLGMRQAGFTAEAAELATALLDAAEAFDWRLPELFSGAPAAQGPPVPYPASCRPQAWAAASAVPIAVALGALPER